MTRYATGVVGHVATTRCFRSRAPLLVARREIIGPMFRHLGHRTGQPSTIAPPNPSARIAEMRSQDYDLIPPPLLQTSAPALRAVAFVGAEDGQKLGRDRRSRDGRAVLLDRGPAASSCLGPGRRDYRRSSARSRVARRTEASISTSRIETLSTLSPNGTPTRRQNAMSSRAVATA